MSSELTKEDSLFWMRKDIADDCGSPYPIEHAKEMKEKISAYTRQKAIAFVHALMQEGGGFIRQLYTSWDKVNKP